MEPIIDHIEITVKDMAVAVPFYDKLMPVLGFDPQRKGGAHIEEHDFDVVEYSRRLAFAINSPRSEVAEEIVHRRRPGLSIISPSKQSHVPRSTGCTSS